MLRVDFLNKNTFRRYPLRADKGVASNEGTELPDELFCAAQFSAPGWVQKLQIRRVYVNEDYINILVSCYNGPTLTYIGYFDGNVTADFSKLTFSSLDPTIYGMLMIGRAAAVRSLHGFYNFGNDTALFEDSLVTHISPPFVRSILVGGKTLSGRISLEYNNVQQIANPAALQLDVLSKDSIRARNDRSAQFGSCRTNPIGSMNTVSPDNDGNIDIYGIAPLQIHVSPGGLRFDIVGVSRSELCAEDRRIPPLIPISSYLRDITRATTPEWKTWPQYTQS
ncbi:hypothetical protein EKK58_01320 [Candidatus Dependentiae bacterium]|nr:MAG: hypothetical protein EKK58_01320 [Candidatus Dependentiae bacterium]